ncbi:type II toxin-antitoxin system ParD family antitoxin [Maricaulis salignorans]|uniref:Antitoxin ParD1/3/4 n=1 Tax=Maricaulis salignorans TaxID=144026 RepID=A0A1G9UYQ0_9PROT|nr:type II toxin-antitoxin system ParD family antitoxin [Maricaulis salignorans]SDM65131.1 antitoxin ParD1/3/4 [Maricaulis salignorans]
MPSSYSLGPRFEALMAELVKSGRYNSKSEILRDGLRMVEEREAKFLSELEELREAVRLGSESGPGIPVEEVFERLTAKYEQMAKDQGLL